MPTTPISLARIAEKTGFTMSDVAFLSGLNESTLSRLWDDPNWLDRLTGKSLQAIIGVIPKVGEYTLSYALSDRRDRLATSLTERGVTVDCAAFRTLIRDQGIAEQYLSNALAVALPILDGDVVRSAACLARFWGHDQSVALSYLMGTPDGLCLLLDPVPLITAAIDILDQLASRVNSFHAIVGHAAIVHHLARVTEIKIPLDVARPNRQTALLFRGLTIGRIIANNDLDLAGHYCSTVADNRVLHAIEEWAYPTYANDARVTHDFSIPRSLVLRNTASAMLRGIEIYNDAYLYYLTTAAIPTLLRRDPSFGGRLAEIKKVLHLRLDSSEPLVRQACADLLEKIDVGDPLEEANFGYSW